MSKLTRQNLALYTVKKLPQMRQPETLSSADLQLMQTFLPQRKLPVAVSKRKDTPYFFFMLRFDVSRCKLQSRRYDSSVIDPAGNRQKIGNNINRQDDISDSTHKYEPDQFGRILILDAIEDSQELREEM